MQNDDSEFLTVKAFAARYGEEPQRVYRKLRAGAVRHVRDGRKILLRRIDWTRYLESLLVGGDVAANDNNQINSK